MAHENSEHQSIFRQSAMSRIANVDDLDKSIKVTNPSAWVVLAAALSFIIGLVIWAALAVVPTTVNVTGIYNEGSILCWVDQSTMEKIKDDGAVARVMDLEMKNVETSDLPLSSAEVKSLVAKYENDYFADAITIKDWNYAVYMDAPSEMIKLDEAVLVPVNITVSETNPLGLLFSRG